MRRVVLSAAIAAALLGLMPRAAVGVEFNDPYAGTQWYLDKMNFPAAWAAVLAEPSRGRVTVAVIDSGFETTHPDLSSNLLPGINIVDGSNDISPVQAHGTATSGLPGATSGNATGISQTAWGVDVLPIRVSNRPDGAAYIDDMANAIYYAADHGARVINISYGGVYSKTLEIAARYAAKKGAITFMAAGNDGFLHTDYKNRRDLIAVGAVDEGDGRSRFSSYGKFVDFVAPGQDIVTLYTDNQYASWAGTSFSSPIAASVAALILEANPLLTPKQVLAVLRASAVDLGTPGRDVQYGFGRPDAAAAVALALDMKGKWKAGATADRVPNDRDGITGLLAGDLDELLPPEGFLTDPQLIGDTAALLANETMNAADLNVVVSPDATVEGVPTPEPATLLMLLVAVILIRPRPRRSVPCAQPTIA